MSYEAIYANFSGNFQMTIYIDDYYFSDVLIYLPIHTLTIIYVSIMLISIANNAYMQHRPKKMFLTSAFFFFLAAAYNFVTDVGYLMMKDKEMTVQYCSIIRNFIQNPIAAQGLVEAIDRYFIIFEHGVLQPIT
ncbi:unnamed protein product [Cylicostephanus goldi]|uniref:G-protein coupled receptors family 1 profile domain-containing protein n=1 Tax=Cylicostephanus goldi TaxID=71465 RepID=A0A3P6SX60_CYLGO|nr:unnamed protein product [Cylicostephanus goldi]